MDRGSCIGEGTDLTEEWRAKLKAERKAARKEAFAPIASAWGEMKKPTPKVNTARAGRYLLLGFVGVILGLWGFDALFLKPPEKTVSPSARPHWEVGAWYRVNRAYANHKPFPACTSSEAYEAYATALRSGDAVKVDTLTIKVPPGLLHKDAMKMQHRFGCIMVSAYSVVQLLEKMDFNGNIKGKFLNWPSFPLWTHYMYFGGRYKMK